MSVWRDIDDAIARPDAQRLQRSRPAVRAVEEGFVGKPPFTIDD
jgi:hypothetical protein